MVRLYSVKQDLFFLIVLWFVCFVGGCLISVISGNPISIIYKPPTERIVQNFILEQNEFGEFKGPIKMKKSIQVIKLKDLQKMIYEGQVIVVDVRVNLFYQLGHIPGSINLQESEYNTDLKKQILLLKKMFTKGGRIVLYCGGKYCSDASKVAKRLLEEELGNLYIFEGGLKAWKKLGLEMETSLEKNDNKIHYR